LTEYNRRAHVGTTWPELNTTVTWNGAATNVSSTNH